MATHRASTRQGFDQRLTQRIAATTAVGSRRARRVAATVLVVSVAAAGALGSVAVAAHPRTGADPQLDVAATRVQRALVEQLESSGIPGGAASVASGGQVEAFGEGGPDGARGVGAATRFVIGSASKSVTALAVMQLVDDGRVDLEESVRRYVPELELAGGEPVEDITVRHLLQQTSGLDDLAGGPLLASAADGSPLQAVEELQDAELASPPGRTWRYANVNYVLAGLVVERASGRSYGEYVQQEIFAPLGMADSSAVMDGDGAAISDGHQLWFGFPAATEPARREATMAAGYLVSTAEDLGRYLSLFLADGVTPDGTRVLSADGVRTLLTPGPVAHLGPWAQGQESRYAMGWFVGGPWGDGAVFHPGNTPDTTTMLTLFPDRDLAVAAVVDAGNELPVPGNPFIADRVTRNVVHAALGQPVQDLPSLWRFYLVFDTVVLLLLAAAVWGVVRARRTLSDLSPLSPRHRGRRWVGVGARTLVLVLLVLAPTASYGWGGLWTWAPDLALTLTLLVLLLTVATVLRTIGLLRSAPRSRHAAPAAAASPHDYDRMGA